MKPAEVSHVLVLIFVFLVSFWSVFLKQLENSIILLNIYCILLDFKRCNFLSRFLFLLFCYFPVLFAGWCAGSERGHFMFCVFV